ncbi:hypothetical protein VNO77_42896 [Canavalia gladiata]|uniref:Uncharacterized protein n=1 Tax=Canavalia gladiata TaxID=3824 RepID=A0AAN9PPJ8_CANGL
MPHFLITTLTATASFIHYNKGTLILLGSLLQHKHNASLFLFNTFTSYGNNRKGDTFTVSYLINSCGVSPALAMKLSNRVHLKNPDIPNAVLDLLNNYGLSKTHVAKLVEKNPSVLIANAEKTLLPKLKFFHSIGVFDSDMPRILLGNPLILARSLEKCIIPRYEILRGIVLHNEKVVSILRKAPLSFTYCHIRNNVVPNIEILRQCGVPQASISILMVHFSRVVYMKHSKFVEAIKAVEEIGFNPLKITFVLAVQVLLTLSKAKRELRFQLYEGWGWDREMTLQAFRKFPNFMKLSEEMFTKKMSFLVKDMGLLSKDIAEYPPVLGYSLEKRIIPRFLVIKILVSKGLLEKNLHFSSFICLPEECFLKKFVENFPEDMPLLADVYKGLIDNVNGFSSIISKDDVGPMVTTALVCSVITNGDLMSASYDQCGEVYSEYAKPFYLDDDIFSGRVTDKWHNFMKGEMQRA